MNARATPYYMSGRRHLVLAVVLLAIALAAGSAWAQSQPAYTVAGTVGGHPWDAWLPSGAYCYTYDITAENANQQEAHYFWIHIGNAHVLKLSELVDWDESGSGGTDNGKPVNDGGQLGSQQHAIFGEPYFWDDSEMAWGAPPNGVYFSSNGADNLAEGSGVPAIGGGNKLEDYDRSHTWSNRDGSDPLLRIEDDWDPDGAGTFYPSYGRCIVWQSAPYDVGTGQIGTLWFYSWNEPMDRQWGALDGCEPLLGTNKGPTPEPVTAALIALGLPLGVLVRRRKQD